MQDIKITTCKIVLVVQLSFFLNYFLQEYWLIKFRKYSKISKLTFPVGNLGNNQRIRPLVLPIEDVQSIAQTSHLRNLPRASHVQTFHPHNVHLK